MEMNSTECSRWRLRIPGRDETGGDSLRAVEGLHAPGFVIAPFDFTLHPVITLTAKTSIPSTLITAPEFPSAETTHGEHSRNVSLAAASHTADHGKTVISRLILAPLNNTPDKLFDILCENYPTATVFLFDSPATGLWTGATPELLLEADGEYLSTMSLAGTRPCGTAGEWDEKNIEEQQIVTRTIAETFSSRGLYPEISDIQTLAAGPVEHLCTRIRASLPQEWSLRDLTDLLRELSPTPALGGYPRLKAIEDIRNLESHDRFLYGGFFGYVENPRRFRLNVNLRSARLHPAHPALAALYTGGGITRLSIPDAEWEETERKASTLLSLL